jgi:hypothetical protein
MKARGAAVQGGLAVLGLVAAYATWQRAPEVGAEDVVILDLSKGDVEKVRFEDNTRWVEIVRGKDSKGAPEWIRFGTRTPPAPDAGTLPDGGVARPDGGAGAADGGTAVAASTPPPPKPSQPDRELKGNELADKLLERFTPMRGSRALGALDKGKLKELGLEDSPRRMEVFARGKSHPFTISSASVSPGAPYVLNQQDSKVYLVSASLVSDLEAASSRLVDRRLHTFTQKEVDAVTLAVGDKKREFVQTANENGIVTKVAPKEAPDKADDFAKNYLEKIWRLIPVDLLGKGEAPATGEPTLQLRLEYLAKGKPLGWLELAKGPSQELYARSEHTASWIKTHLSADEALADSKKLAEAK